MSSSPSLPSFTFYYYPFYFSFHLSFTLTIQQAKLISIPKTVPASQKTQHITVTELISLRPTTKTAALHSLQSGGARDSHCPYTVKTLVRVHVIKAHSDMRHHSTNSTLQGSERSASRGCIRLQSGWVRVSASRWPTVRWRNLRAALQNYLARC